MHILNGAAWAATALSVAVLGATASSEPARLSDTAYMQAARCVGLASSHNLGGGDAAAMDKWLRKQSSGRDPYVQDRADELQASAKREGDRADSFSKPRLQAELSGACASLKS